MRWEKEYFWNDEKFLCKACDQMIKQLDWDSLDSGRLHHVASEARTLDGQQIIVGVISKANVWDEALKDAEDECKYCQLPETTPLWLYVPEDLNVPDNIAKQVCIQIVLDEEQKKNV